MKKKITARAPLRLSLAGGGTELSPFVDDIGGAVLNATISMYAYCELEESSDNHIFYESLDLNIRDEVSIDEVETSGPENLKLHHAIYQYVIKEFYNNKYIAVSIKTHSDAPVGSGLGASSTLTIAILQAFNDYLNLGLGDYELAKHAFIIERKKMNLNGGRQDQYAASFGGFNFIEFNPNDQVIVNPLRLKNEYISILESNIVLYYTGRSRESANIISSQTKKLESGDVEIYKQLNKIKELVNPMKNSLLTGDIKSLAKGLQKNWEIKKETSSSISTPEINSYIDAAYNSGALAAKILGAGGGGFMMFIVPLHSRVKVISKLKELCPQGFFYPCVFTSVGVESWEQK
jgi:D-glycero-alpha-D-manno-heptose-7-phosphate kinase